MAIKHNLIYGDVSANDYGIFISGEGVYNAPSRNVETVDVPGRNGSLTIDQGSYTNITIEYPAFTFAISQSEFRRKLNAFKNAIMSQVGYQRLWDDYHPDDYREALYIEGLEVDPVQLGRAGSFTLSFNCKPQRYLTSGQEEVTVTNNTIMNNPTLYDAEPLLMVKGYGAIGFNGYQIDLENGAIGAVTLWQTAYKSGSSESMNVSISKTFDSALLASGDTFTFGVRQAVNVYDEVETMTNTNAGATSSYSDNNDGSVMLATDLDCSFAAGTARTITNTSVFTLVSTDTLTAVMSVVYDGADTVTFTTTYTATDENSLGSYLNAYIYSCTAVSSLNLLGDPTYIDCEIGEAYKFVDTSLVGLNSYIDLGSDLPKLASGSNTFTVSNTITELKVIPRWWQL